MIQRSDKNEYNRIIKQGGVVFGGRVYGQLILNKAFDDWELKIYKVICITKIIIEEDDKYLVFASDEIDEDGLDNSKKL